MTDWILEDKLQDMEKVPNSYLDHIATYIRFKKFPIENSKQLSLYISRNAKIAKELTAFTTKQILQIMETLEADYQYRLQNKGKSNDWKWSLETILKQLMK